MKKLLGCVGFVLLVTATSAFCAELDVSELIVGIKRAVQEAQKTATAPYMAMPWIEGEISYLVRKEGEGGFKLSVITAEGKYATEAVQKFRFRLEPRKGEDWRVESESEIRNASVSGVDPRAKKIFISTGLAAAAAYKVLSETKITDYKGKTKTLGDISAGSIISVHYKPDPEGLPRASSVIIEELKKK